MTARKSISIEAVKTAQEDKLRTKGLDEHPFSQIDLLIHVRKIPEDRVCGVPTQAAMAVHTHQGLSPSQLAAPQAKCFGWDTGASGQVPGPAPTTGSLACRPWGSAWRTPLPQEH